MAGRMAVNVVESGDGEPVEAIWPKRDTASSCREARTKPEIMKWAKVEETKRFWAWPVTVAMACRARPGDGHGSSVHALMAKAKV
ncbi:hypothetical protein AMTR_s00175p00063840 [Amborella trichopoda]|uniref:Uncharacterized protein n=1 Tax=Amborella trichopoda TaxID=13333 RepID=U5CRX6_AMBTC|nr:hypothetical protein AMTR_s00175p00063840 [Amborella trichopoda]